MMQVPPYNWRYVGKTYDAGVLDCAVPSSSWANAGVARHSRRPLRRFDSLQRLPAQPGVDEHPQGPPRWLRRHRNHAAASVSRAARARYLLTEKGRDLAPALIALTEWGDRWSAPEGPPILLQPHRVRLGVSHEVVCANCGRVDDAAEVQARPRPRNVRRAHRVDGEPHRGPVGEPTSRRALGALPQGLCFAH